MKYKNELENIKKFIEQFNPDEFSSSEDLPVNNLDESVRLSYAQRYKARMKRKKQMEQSFLVALEKSNPNDTDVTITQEQIDELLAQQL